MSDNKITIRQAKPYDVSNLCRLLEQAHDKEHMYPDPDPYMVVNWVTGVISEGYVVLAEKSGRVNGTIGLTNYQFPWSKKFYLYVDWMFVSKSFRAGGVFEGLLTAVHAFADSQFAPIFGGIHSGKDARLLDRLMQQKSYAYLGGQFLRSALVKDEELSDGQREEEDNQHI